MDDFKGGNAAIAAIRFASTNLAVFAMLVVTWAVIATLADVAYSLLAQPAGAGASIGVQLDAMAESRASRFVDLLPSVLSNLVISVNWIQFVLLDRKPRHPFQFSGEMAGYFGTSIRVGFFSILAAVPGVIVGFIITATLGSPTGTVIAIVIGALMASAGVLTVFIRTFLALPAVVLDRPLSTGDTFELTKGHAFTLGWGYVIIYLPVIVAIVVAAGLGTLITDAGLVDAGELLSLVLTNILSIAATGLTAGFMANAYRALVPGDPTGRIANQFE